MRQEVAEELTQALAEGELTLGTVECGVGGAVSHRLFETEHGFLTVGDCLIVEDVDTAIGLMDLPRPQFRKQGAFSAKAARAAAREGCDFMGVDLCLAVWAPPPTDPWRAPQPIHLALNTGEDVVDETLQCQASRDQGLDWIVDQALDMMCRALLE